MQINISTAGLRTHAGDGRERALERDVIPRLGTRDLGDDIQLELMFPGAREEEPIDISITLNAQTIGELWRQQSQFALEQRRDGFAFAGRFCGDVHGKARFVLGNFGVVTQFAENDFGRWRGWWRRFFVCEKRGGEEQREERLHQCFHRFSGFV